MGSEGDKPYRLAERVAEIRQYRGWSVAYLAERATLHEMMVRRLERSARKPDPEGRVDLKGKTILALADALGVDADYLLGRTEQPKLDKR